MKINPDLVDSPEFEFRTILDVEELEEDIKQNGQLFPGLVRPKPNDRYELVYGKRRLTVCRNLSIDFTAEVRDLTDEEAFKIALNENYDSMHKSEGLVYIDESRVFSEAIIKKGWTQKQLSDLINKTEAYVSQRILIYIKIPKEEREEKRGEIPKFDPLTQKEWSLVHENQVRSQNQKRKRGGAHKGEITFSHALELTKLVVPDKTKQTKQRQRIIKEIEEKDHSVTRTQAAVKQVVRGPPKPKEPRELCEHNVFFSRARDNAYGDGKFPGCCDAYEIKQCILRYTEPGAVILDSMAGSGTTLDLVNNMNLFLDKKYTIYTSDLIPVREDILKQDARDLSTPPLSLNDESVDFIFNHFPYWKMKVYSSDPNDLSTMSLPDFLNVSRSIIKETHRVLKDAGTYVIMIGLLREEGKLYDLVNDLQNIARQEGFSIHDKLIKLQVNESSAGAYYGDKPLSFFLIRYETLLVFKKGERINGRIE